MDDDDRFLITTAEAGRLLSLSERTVWDLVHREPGFPKPVRIGGSTRWLRAKLEAWARARAGAAQPQQAPSEGLMSDQNTWKARELRRIAAAVRDDALGANDRVLVAAFLEQLAEHEEDFWREIEIAGRTPNPLLQDLPMVEAPAGSAYEYRPQHRLPEVKP